MDTLTTLLNALPAELFNEIYNLTFTPNRHPRLIDESYRPPCTLQINCKTRSRFANLYYGNSSIFHVTEWISNKWANSVPKAHLHLISEIRILSLAPVHIRIPPPVITDPILRQMARRFPKPMPNVEGALATVSWNVLKFEANFRESGIGWASSRQLIDSGFVLNRRGEETVGAMNE